MIKKILLALVLTLVIVYYIIVPYTYVNTNTNWESDVGLSAYSDKWDDLSQFKGDIENNANPKYQVLSIVSTTTFLRSVGNPTKSVLVVIGVEKKYSELEVEAVEKFVRAGGKMILADDGGLATSVSEKFGVYFYNGMLWENETYGIWVDGKLIKNKTYPYINATIDKKQYEIATNGPTALYFEESLKSKIGTVYANSSRKSYLDFNKNGLVDLDDKQGPMTIAVEIPVDDGKIIFISDPDMFVNGMLKTQGDNSEFALALIEHLLPSGGSVIFDESRHNQNKYLENEYQTTAFITFMLSSEGIGFSVAGTYLEIFPSLLSISLVVILVAIATIKIKDKERWVHKYDITTFKPLPTPLPRNPGEQQEILAKLIKEKVRIMSSLSVEEVNKIPKEKLRKYIPDKTLAEFVENSKGPYTPDDLKKIVAKIDDWKR